MPLLIATSESRGLPISAGGRQQRGTRGAEVLQVRCPGNNCLLSRTHETGSKSSWLSGRLSFCCLLPWLSRLWSRPSCRVWSSGPVVWFRPLSFRFLKRGHDPGHRPKDRSFGGATTQGPIFRQASPSTYNLLGRGTGCWEIYYYLFLSFPPASLSPHSLLAGS